MRYRAPDKIGSASSLRRKLCNHTGCGWQVPHFTRRPDQDPFTLQPLKFMEYSMEATMPVVLLARTGPIVVNVPRPERIALIGSWQ